MAIQMVLRKIMHNKGLMASLFVGMLLAGALTALIPAYARMSLNRTQQKELEAYQQETAVYPGMAFSSAFYNENDALDALAELNSKGLPAYQDKRILTLLEKRKDDIAAFHIRLDTLDLQLGLVPLIRIDNLASTSMQMSVENSRRNIKKTGRLQSLTQLEKNMTLLRGELPKEPENGIYQALATEEALINLGAEVGDILACVPRLDQTHPPVLVKITGTFDVDPEQPLAWGFFKPAMFKDSLLLRPCDAETILLSAPVLAASVRSYTAYDYRQMLSNGLLTYLGPLKELNRQLKPLGASFDMPVLAKAVVFAAKEENLKTTLWMLNIPVLLMLLLYMAMVSGLVIDSDETEISMLSSRGAGKGLIFSSYLSLGMLLALGALIFSPLLAVLLCRMLGMANGFLSFAARSVPKVMPGVESYVYCAISLATGVCMLAFPAARRQQISIVLQRRTKDKKDKQPIWSRLGLDMLLLAFSMGGWYLLKTKPEWMASFSGELNPAVFALMPCFASGLILFFLRVYPCFIRLLTGGIVRFLKAGPYLALMRVSRTFSSYRYIMFFLSMTMAVGLFSASAARTLNDNDTDRLAYQIGADVVLSVNWTRQGVQNAYISQNGQKTEQVGTGTRRYQEPPFTPFQKLTGVMSAARVFTRKAVQAAGVGTAGNVQLMAIDPADFGRTAWFRNDMWRAHFYDYLNALSIGEQGCLISSSLAGRINARMGDLITISWEGSDTASFVVVGIVNYWPGWNPHPASQGEAEPMLVVADLNDVQSTLATEPYGVWLKLNDDANIKALYDDMQIKGIAPAALRNFRQENIALINASSRMAVNGVMSAGFISSCIVCLLGFTLYWHMYLQKNQLQLGLQRGMGFTLGQLLQMLLAEQMLTSLASLLFGVAAGLISSVLFVPLFDSVQGIRQAPPFRLRMQASDRMAIYIVIGGMLLICLCYLGMKMKRMKVAQAIKLGED